MGNVTTITTPRLATITFGPFNLFNQPQVMKDARGNYTVMKYDVSGNLLEEIKLRAGALAPAAAYIPVMADVASWSINTYDTVTTPTGNLLTSKKVRDFATLAGPTVTFTYDASELFPTQISRLGDKTGDGLINAADPADGKTLAQDVVGRVTTGIDGDWQTTTFTYDAIDRVKTGTDAVGKTRSFSYDKNGSLLQNDLTIAAVSYDRTQYGYDASDRLTLPVSTSVAAPPAASPARSTTPPAIPSRSPTPMALLLPSNTTKPTAPSAPWTRKAIKSSPSAMSTVGPSAARIRTATACSTPIGTTPATANYAASPPPAPTPVRA